LFALHGIFQICWESRHSRYLLDALNTDHDLQFASTYEIYSVNNGALF